MGGCLRSRLGGGAASNWPESERVGARKGGRRRKTSGPSR